MHDTSPIDDGNETWQFYKNASNKMEEQILQ